MAKKKKSTKSSYKKYHDKRVKERNEMCFLENKEKMKYHSFILLDIIPLEKKRGLIEGLYRLYAGAPPNLQSRLDFKKMLSESHSELFRGGFINLPYITTDKLKGKILSHNRVFHDIGSNIRTYQIGINKVMPSTLVLQVQVYLDFKPSKKINKIIYKYHKETKKSVETPEGKHERIYPLEKQKESEVYAFRKGLHKEAVKFLSQYFKGYFFESSNADFSAIPTIDLFSLEYPPNENGISEWIRKNRGFLSCLSAVPAPYGFFKYENYLLCTWSKEDTKFQNYSIFANRKTTGTSMYPDIDIAIEEVINYCSFDSVAIIRWVTMQQEVVASLNNAVSEETWNIDKKFDKTIKKAKSIFKETFLFNRFVSEFKIYDPLQDRFHFKNIRDERYPGGEVEFFKDLKKEIESRLRIINQIIYGLNIQYQTIFNLKNVEFNNKIQKAVVVLTVVVVILTTAQIIIALKIPDTILRLFIGR